MEIYLFVLVSVVSCFPGLLMRYIPFASLLTPRERARHRIVNLLLALIYGAIVGILTHIVGIRPPWLKFSSVFFGIASAVLNLFLIPGRVKENIFAWGLSAMLNNFFFTIADYSISHIQGLSELEHHIYDGTLFLLLISLGYYPIRNLLRKTITPFLDVATGNYWNTIFMIPGALYLSAVLTLPMDILGNTPYPVLSRILLNIATVLICLSIAGDRDRMRLQHDTQRQLDIQTQYYQALEAQVASSRKARHDLKHHMAAIQRYIDTDDKNGLQVYCQNFQATHTPHVMIPYSGHHAADGVLYQGMLRADAENIRFDLIGTIHSSGIEDVDLCVLLGNAIDNALEGCLTVKSGRFISVIAETEEYVLSIVVHNSFDGKIVTQDDHILSRKRDHLQTGIGLASMAEICEKYGGTLNTAYDEGTFTVLISLPLQPEEK